MEAKLSAKFDELSVQISDLGVRLQAQTNFLQAQISDLASATKKGFDEVSELRKEVTAFLRLNLR